MLTLMKLDGDYMNVHCTIIYNFLYLKYSIIKYVFKNSVPRVPDVSK